jgi:acyl-CoA synthetase (AMP-forming)/AMP-acid ligase II
MNNLTNEQVLELLNKNVRVDGLCKEEYKFKDLMVLSEWNKININLNKYSVFRIVHKGYIIPQKHLEIYLKWKLEDKVVELWHNETKKWKYTATPLFLKNAKYRIRPEFRFRTGDIFKLELEGKYYILTNVEPNKYCLVSLTNGNRWIKPKRINTVASNNYCLTLKDLSILLDQVHHDFKFGEDIKLVENVKIEINGNTIRED